MLDAFHLPPLHGDNHVSIFTAAETTSGFAIWRKPRGAANMSAIIIGAGGGGGGGHSAAAGNARGGGGGGGSGAITRFHAPLFLLPDMLYVQVGIGGAGGGATVDGSAGGLSYICTAPNTSVSNMIHKSGGAAAQGGAKGTNGTGGGGGAAETATNFTTLSAPWLGILNGIAVAGQAGGNGGAQTGAAGTSITFAAGQGLPVTSGAGGGGTPIGNTDYAGGDINKPSGALIVPTVAGGTAAGGAGGYYYAWQPFISTGGSGGGTNGASGAGGAGGNGGPGSGGGGGGGGVTGGAGGRGGDGLVMIWAW